MRNWRAVSFSSPGCLRHVVIWACSPYRSCGHLRCNRPCFCNRRWRCLRFHRFWLFASSAIRLPDLYRSPSGHRLIQCRFPYQPIKFSFWLLIPIHQLKRAFHRNTICRNILSRRAWGCLRSSGTISAHQAAKSGPALMRRPRGAQGGLPPDSVSAKLKPSANKTRAQIYNALCMTLVSLRLNSAGSAGASPSAIRA